MEESKSQERSFDITKKYKHWVFTLQNPTDEQIDELINNDIFEYIVIGKEIAPTTGQPHGQGFCSFKNQRYFKAVQKILGGCFCEPKAQFSTTDQAIEYCKKDGNFKEKGVPTLTSRRIEGMLYTLATMSELLADIDSDVYDENEQLQEIEDYIHELACDTESVLYELDNTNCVFDIAENCNRCASSVACQHSYCSDLDDCDSYFEMDLDTPST